MAKKGKKIILRTQDVEKIRKHLIEGGRLMIEGIGVISLSDVVRKDNPLAEGKVAFRRMKIRASTDFKKMIKSEIQ